VLARPDAAATDSLSASRLRRVTPGDFAQNFEAAFAKFQIAVETAYAAETDWPMAAAAAIRAVLEFAAEDPIAARALTVDSLAQGSDHFAHHKRPVDHLASMLAAGRKAHPDGEALPSLLEDALAGGILMLVVQRLEVGDTRTLARLAPDAIEFALTPCVGRDTAHDVAMAAGEAPDSWPAAKLRRPLYRLDVKPPKLTGNWTAEGKAERASLRRDYLELTGSQRMAQVFELSRFMSKVSEAGRHQRRA